MRPKRDGCHGGTSRIGHSAGRGFVGGRREKKALTRRLLDRAGWWRRRRYSLSSQIRVDSRISPLGLYGNEAKPRPY